MNVIVLLVLASLTMGAIGLAVFFWTYNTGQYNDLDGAAERILIDDEDTDAVDS